MQTDPVNKCKLCCFVCGIPVSYTHLKIQREDAKIPNVLADPARLRDVLVNILSNAVKYTPDGGTITFEARCQEKGGDCLLYTSIWC